MFKIKGLPQNVIILGAISFLTDTANDMIYPLLPTFLKEELGAGESLIGFIEGFSESTFAFFTFFTGLWTDQAADRSHLVRTGYTISCLSKPLVALAWTPWVIFILRVLDRVGKGIRTAPRDAILGDSVSNQKRGMAYGFQRALDNAGSVSGPLIAMVLLTWFIDDLRVLFMIAIIPALMALGLNLWKVREVKKERAKAVKLTMPSGKLKAYLVILFLFTLSTSSDAFLILRASELGVETPQIPVIWMVFSIVISLSLIPFGMLSDQVDRLKVILFGRIIYMLVYMAFAFAFEFWHAWALFAFYGLFYGLTEGSERALIADYTDSKERGRNFGWYYLTIGLAVLPANLIFGFLWENFGSKTAFLTGAAISFLSIILLIIFRWKNPPARLSENHYRA